MRMMAATEPFSMAFLSVGGRRACRELRSGVEALVEDLDLHDPPTGGDGPGVDAEGGALLSGAGHCGVDVGLARLVGRVPAGVEADDAEALLLAALDRVLADRGLVGR